MSSVHFTNQLDNLFQEWVRQEYKAKNYSGTYSKEALLKFIKQVEDWTMCTYCVKEGKSMDTIYKLEPSELKEQ